MAEENLKIKVSVDSNQAQSGLQKLLNTFGGLKTILPTIGLAAVIGLFKNMVNEASAAERAVSRLNTILRNQGIYSAALSNNLQEYASALQLVTTYSDEEILASNEIFLRYGLQVGQVKALTKATLDFATAKGIDLASASEMVARTIGSDTNALARQGVVVNAVKGSTERYTQLLSELSRLSAGQAQAATGTYTGKLLQLKNQQGELNESIGKMFLPGLIDVVTWLGKGATAANKFLTAIGIGESLEATENRLKLAKERSKELNDEIFKLSNTKAGKVLTGGLGEKSPLVSAYKREKAKLDAQIAKDEATVKAKKGTGKEDEITGNNQGETKDTKETIVTKQTEIDDMLKTAKEESFRTEIEMEVEKASAILAIQDKTLRDKLLNEQNYVQGIKDLAEFEKQVKLKAATESVKAEMAQAKTGDDFFKSIMNSQIQAIKNAFIAQLLTNQIKEIATIQMAIAGHIATLNWGGAAIAAGQLAVPAAISATAIGAINAITPQLAEGGIVPATNGGRLVTVAEGGQDEAIIPLDKAGMGNITIVVNGGLLGDSTSAREFAKAVDQELYKLKRAGQSIN